VTQNVLDDVSGGTRSRSPPAPREHRFTMYESPAPALRTTTSGQQYLAGPTVRTGPPRPLSFPRRWRWVAELPPRAVASARAGRRAPASCARCVRRRSDSGLDGSTAAAAIAAVPPPRWLGYTGTLCADALARTWRRPRPGAFVAAAPLAENNVGAAAVVTRGGLRAGPSVCARPHTAAGASAANVMGQGSASLFSPASNCVRRGASAWFVLLAVDGGVKEGH
jgi:hypothetical protein